MKKKPFKNHSILLKSVWIWTNLMVLNLRIVFDPSKTRLFEIFKVKMKSNWSLSDIISRNWYFEEKVQPFINYILYWNQTIRPEIRWINPLNGKKFNCKQLHGAKLRAFKLRSIFMWTRTGQRPGLSPIDLFHNKSGIMYDKSVIMNAKVMPSNAHSIKC